MIYAYSWFLDLVNDRWEGLVMNDYEAVMPLTPGRKMGIDYLFQPRFTQQLGVFSQLHLTDKIVRDFLDKIPAKYQFIEINLNTHNKIHHPGKHFHQWKTHEIDLINDYDQIANAYSTNLKRNLKKATKSSLQIVENIKPENVIRIFRKSKGNIETVTGTLPSNISNYLLNKKRSEIVELEKRYGVSIEIQANPNLSPWEGDIKLTEKSSSKEA